MPTLPRHRPSWKRQRPSMPSRRLQRFPAPAFAISGTPSLLNGDGSRASIAAGSLGIRRLPGRWHQRSPMARLSGSPLRWCIPTTAVPLAPHFPLASNGLASGNKRSEAVCSAIFELIERDAASLWRQRASVAKASRRVDLDTIDHEVCRSLVERLAARKMAVSVWDTTTDVGVAAFLCRIEEAPERGRQRLGGFYGSGCHLARDVAFLRAVTEAVQTRLTYIAGSRDDLRRRDYSESATEFSLQPRLLGVGARLSTAAFCRRAGLADGFPSMRT